ncbi:MAG: flagellar export protein FliJ [Holosporales bacterium]
MKALIKLIRMTKGKVDEQRQAIGRIQLRLNQVNQQIDALQNHLNQERKVGDTSFDGTWAFYEYAENVDRHLQRLARQKKEIQLQLEREQERLRPLYAELKTLEITSARYQERARQAEARKEQQQMDEFAVLRASFKAET